MTKSKPKWPLCHHSTDQTIIYEHPINRITSVTTDREQRSRTSPRPRPTPPQGSTCNRCGNTDHFFRDPTCPDRGMPCSNCGGVNHFSAVCKSKSRANNQVRLIQQVSSGESDNERAYVFQLPDSRNRGPTITANIGGVDMSILVDSGATKTLSMRLHGNG